MDAELGEKMFKIGKKQKNSQINTHFYFEHECSIDLAVNQHGCLYSSAHHQHLLKMNYKPNTVFYLL